MVLGNTSSGGIGANAPLMTSGGTNVGDTSVGSHQTGAGPEGEDEDGYRYKAKALYACKCNNLFYLRFSRLIVSFFV